MTTTTGRREPVVGIDPDREVHLGLARAADETHRRGPALRLVAVPPQHADDTPRHRALTRRAQDALRAAADRARCPVVVAGDAEHALTVVPVG
ncbi:hypothetical protein [Streptomyces sp. BPSDS2]|uniref:hypothetical protein n=1 Tax=Streptomyces sp. BPSDS2 TaxID=2571021 RepID=UPI0010C22F05|nr:hypothetical protein [Streptomyces sp. BPSDS2]